MKRREDEGNKTQQGSREKSLESDQAQNGKKLFEEKCWLGGIIEKERGESKIIKVDSQFFPV